MAADKSYQPSGSNYQAMGGKLLVIGGTLELATGCTVTYADAANVIAAQKVNYTTGDLDSEAEIIAAINATNTALNALLVAVKTFGIVKSS